MHQNKNSAIGVFDSGIGGLTVLEQLIKLFPNEDFCYIADQGHCPYGTKTAKQIGDRVEKVSARLIEKGVKAIVIACNTASLHIDRARAITDIPVVSVIYPTCARAVSLTRNKKVAVLATQATINSGTYQRLLEKENITPVPLACGEFVDFVESHDLDDPMADKVVADKFLQLPDRTFDTLIHGCTHFSLLENSMRKCLGDKKFVACGEPTGEYLKKLLEEQQLLTTATGKGRVEIYTTGSVENANATMKWFKAEHSPVQHIDID